MSFRRVLVCGMLSATGLLEVSVDDDAGWV
jgi:hypothetical protein